LWGETIVEITSWLKHFDRAIRNELLKKISIFFITGSLRGCGLFLSSFGHFGRTYFLFRRLKLLGLTKNRLSWLRSDLLGLQKTVQTLQIWSLVGILSQHLAENLEKLRRISLFYRLQ
jgi:hypothetical protein